MKRKVGRRWTFALALMMTIAGCAGWWNKEPARESAATGAPKPNVLFLHIDDLNNRLGCYGDPLVQSPNIDRLAARGLRFDMAYCQYPLCNPSRTSMLTSLLPEVTRITDNETAPRSMMPDMISMPQYFQTQGYYAASVGKIFHTPFPDAKSWNEELKWSGATPKGKRNAGGMARGAKRKPPRAAAKRAKREGKQSGGDVNSRWEATRGGDEQEEDGVSARAAAEFLARKHDKPFFLAVGFRKPHLPYVAPQKYFDLYDLDKMPVASTPPGDRDDIPAAAFKTDRNKGPHNDDEARENIRAYYACISFMDAQVGLVLDALEASDAARNTIIVFVSDHGYHLGEHGGLWRKMSVFEESARVPMIIYVPGMKHHGKATSSLAEQLDLYPTLADLCGVEIPKGLMGMSLRPILENPKASIHDCAYTIVRHGDTLGRSVRTERWRYTEWGGPGAAELYDHKSDPHEFTNLAKNPKYADTVAEMRKLLEQRKPHANSGPRQISAR